METDTSATWNSITSSNLPATTYLDTCFGRSCRNSIATRITRSALMSFWRYVSSARTAKPKQFPVCCSVHFLTVSWSLFCLQPKSTSPSSTGPLMLRHILLSACTAALKSPCKNRTHTHMRSRNVEVRSAKWCEFQDFVSAEKREPSLSESSSAQGPLLLPCFV